ncbi:four-carbon acid sugar kinase family protein [Caldicellulosiruptoraceae bacterium PP1]
MIGVVADDITGANDIGIMFAKKGLLTIVISYDVARELNKQSINADIIIIDTNSRFDTEKVAYEKAYNSTKILKEIGCDKFYKKTCSVFRGNVGAEFDAMLDALNEKNGYVVAAFPKNGRQTLYGIHYVHGKKLEHSEFRKDPMHPMTESYLPNIVSKQTKRTIGVLNIEDLRNDKEYVKKIVQEKEKILSYLIFDCENQEDLRKIAELIYNKRVFMGSSAIAEELADLIFKNPIGLKGINLPKKNNYGILCAAGSLMPQTKRQIEHLKSLELPYIVIDTTKIFDETIRINLIDEISDRLAKILENGQDAVVYTANSQEEVEETKSIGRKKGLSEVEILNLVSSTLADIVKKTKEKLPINRIVVAGGETSAAVCNKLNINKMIVWKEIQSGLPSCVSEGSDNIMLVLKSGSFGSDDFLKEAIEHLKENITN